MNSMQQEFDAVVAHLYAQGRPATRGNDCFYRKTGDDGKVLSCAVGCRIPDDVYTEGMDAECDEWSGTGLTTLLGRYESVLPKEISAYKDMFSDLQSAHDVAPDGPFDFERLAERLKRVATMNDLKFTPPTI